MRKYPSYLWNFARKPYIRPKKKIKKIQLTLSRYLVETLEVPHSFEQLRTTTAGHVLRPLIKSLSETCHHPEIVKALLYVAIFSFFEIRPKF